MDGWNTSFLLGWPIFRGELLVSGANWCIGMPLSSDPQVLCQPPPAKLLDRQPLPLRLLPLSKADSRRMLDQLTIVILGDDHGFLGILEELLGNYPLEKLNSFYRIFQFV